MGQVTYLLPSGSLHPGPNAILIALLNYTTASLCFLIDFGIPYESAFAMDWTPTPFTPLVVEPGAEPQPIPIEQLRQNPVRFNLSLTSHAWIMFGTPRADNTHTPVILRTLGKDDGSGRRECSICHDDSADDAVYLECCQCRRRVHVGCMGDWLEQRSILINFNCPQWEVSQAVIIVYCCPY